MYVADICSILLFSYHSSYTPSWPWTPLPSTSTVSSYILSNFFYDSHCTSWSCDWDWAFRHAVAGIICTNKTTLASHKEFLTRGRSWDKKCPSSSNNNRFLSGLQLFCILKPKEKRVTRHKGITWGGRHIKWIQWEEWTPQRVNCGWRLSSSSSLFAR